MEGQAGHVHDGASETAMGACRVPVQAAVFRAMQQVLHGVSQLRHQLGSTVPCMALHVHSGPPFGLLDTGEQGTRQLPAGPALCYHLSL